MIFCLSGKELAAMHRENDEKDPKKDPIKDDVDIIERITKDEDVEDTFKLPKTPPPGGDDKK
jgi:hypothetical protein